MRKILLLCVLLFLVFPSIAYANGAGLPPFFKINGKDSISNPLQTFGITAQSFLIPQDFAAENYIVNKPIDFTIDESQLEPVIPQELLGKAHFSWDFGDGKKAEGLTNTHTYSKMGSYILALTINIYETNGQPPTQFIDSFLINVIPDNGYTLPQAVITVNNQQVKDPLNKPLPINLKDSVDFDASSSKSQAKIVSYLWNFGDGETSTEKIVTHTYSSKYFSTVVLRVKDSNGFISDAFVGLSNDAKAQKKIVKPSLLNSNSLLSLLGGLVLLILLVAIAIKMRRNK